jgi:hypothetical protein
MQHGPRSEVASWFFNVRKTLKELYLDAHPDGYTADHLSIKVSKDHVGALPERSDVQVVSDPYYDGASGMHFRKRAWTDEERQFAQRQYLLVMMAAVWLLSHPENINIVGLLDLFIIPYLVTF